MKTRDSHVSNIYINPQQLSKVTLPNLAKQSGLAKPTQVLGALGLFDLSLKSHDAPSTFSAQNETKTRRPQKSFKFMSNSKNHCPIHICSETKINENSASNLLLPCGLIGLKFYSETSNFNNHEMESSERRRSSVHLLPLGPPKIPVFFNIAMDVDNCLAQFTSGFDEWMNKYQENLNPIKIAQRLTRCCKRHLAIIAPVITETNNVHANLKEQLIWFEDLAHFLVSSQCQSSSSEALEAFVNRVEQAPRYVRMVEVCVQIANLVDKMILSEEAAGVIGTRYRDIVVLTCISAIISTAKQNLPDLAGCNSSTVQSLIMDSEDRVQMKLETDTGFTTSISVNGGSDEQINLVQETKTRWGQSAVTFERTIRYSSSSSQDNVYDEETVKQTYGKLENAKLLQQSSPSFESPELQNILIYEPDLPYPDEMRNKWLKPLLVDGGDNGSQSNAEGSNVEANERNRGFVIKPDSKPDVDADEMNEKMFKVKLMKPPDIFLRRTPSHYERDKKNACKNFKITKEEALEFVKYHKEPCENQVDETVFNIKGSVPSLGTKQDPKESQCNMRQWVFKTNRCCLAKAEANTFRAYFSNGETVIDSSFTLKCGTNDEAIFKSESRDERQELCIERFEISLKNNADIYQEFKEMRKEEMIDEGEKEEDEDKSIAFLGRAESDSNWDYTEKKPSKQSESFELGGNIPESMLRKSNSSIDRQSAIGEKDFHAIQEEALVFRRSQNESSIITDEIAQTGLGPSYKTSDINPIKNIYFHIEDDVSSLAELPPEGFKVQLSLPDHPSAPLESLVSTFQLVHKQGFPVEVNISGGLKEEHDQVFLDLRNRIDRDEAVEFIAGSLVEEVMRSVRFSIGRRQWSQIHTMTRTDGINEATEMDKIDPILQLIAPECPQLHVVNCAKCVNKIQSFKPQIRSIKKLAKVKLNYCGYAVGASERSFKVAHRIEMIIDFREPEDVKITLKVP